jgi:hypothetical protein
MKKLGRNDPCHCGSGKKYKKCCEAADLEKERADLEQHRAQAAANAPAPEEKAAPAPASKNVPVVNQPKPHLKRGMLPRRP